MANPIYNISMQCTPQQGMITTSTTVATTARGDAADVYVDYEEVNNNHDDHDNNPSTPITASQSATDVWRKVNILIEGSYR